LGEQRQDLVAVDRPAQHDELELARRVLERVEGRARHLVDLHSREDTADVHWRGAAVCVVEDAQEHLPQLDARGLVGGERLRQRVALERRLAVDVRGDGAGGPRTQVLQAPRDVDEGGRPCVLAAELAELPLAPQ
jgi:hypothetical protein